MNKNNKMCFLKRMMVSGLVLSLTISSYIPSVAATSSSTEIKIYKGESASLKTILNLSSRAMFTSFEPEILSADTQGTIYGLKKGTANVEVEDNGKITKYKVKVKNKGLMYPKLTLLKGEKVNLNSCFSTKFKDLKWSTSDKNIATVSKNGHVKTKSIGDATIYCSNDKHSFKCNLYVEKHPKSIIYLTFDDGPSRTSTPKILKILKKQNVKATFFEITPSKDNYDLTRKIIKEGHSLAIHGYSHDYNKIYRSETAYRENLDKLRKLFFKQFGVWCVNTRFPGGSSNMVSRFNRGIMTRLTKLVPKWGYKYFDWNVSSSDAGGAKNSKQVYRSVKKGLKKGTENVVLMHDFNNNFKTINALNKIINYGKKHGFTFKTITPGTTEVHHGVNN